MMYNALWLASWYPNRKDPFDGDFIERHALAVSRYVKLTVLFVAKDESIKNNTVETEKSVRENLTVYKVYYGRSGWGGVPETFFSYRKYMQLQKRTYRQIVSETGEPDIVHVHVAMKAGLLARWLRKKYHIPFVVTEHWSGYNPGCVPNIYNSNRVFRTLNKKILEDAALFLPVSHGLGKMVNDFFTSVPYKVVPNSVDTGLFYYQPAVNKKFCFIHPSNMAKVKNPGGILNACKLVKESGYDFELLMIGNKDEKLVLLSKRLGISGQVTFEAPVPYPQVAKRMQQSSALLLFSRYESLPCVILEALCCGLPVISSRVGGIPEVIDKGNGILVDSEDEPGLASAMIKMINSYPGYDRIAIAEKARGLFNYDAVGLQYTEIYKSIVNNPKSGG